MNQSKMKDIRFRNKWLLSGAIPKKPIAIKAPFIVDALSLNERNSWYTITAGVNNNYTYFVTRRQLTLGTNQVLPKDAIDFEQGRFLVSLYPSGCNTNNTRRIK